MGAGAGGVLGRRSSWLAVLLGAGAIAAAGCGSSSNDSGGGGGGSNASSTPADTSVASAPSDIKWPDPQPAVAPQKGGSGTPIKVAIMSECKGAFGAFD